MTSLVSLQACADYAKVGGALSALLAPLGGLGAFVRPGQRVLLKPNLLMNAGPDQAVTTHPEIVRAVLRAVRAAGGLPMVGDSPADVGDLERVWEGSGLAAVCAAEGASRVMFESGGSKQFVLHGRTFSIARAVLEADVVINLPKVKSHMQLTLTLGVKNLFGCVPGKMKAWWHMEAGKDVDRFAQMLIETARAINPELTILDGIVGHEGNGPSTGEPRDLGVLAASRDVFALDRVMVEVLGVRAQDVPTVAAAIRSGLCSDLEAIEIIGDPVARLQCPDWKLPETMMAIDFGMPRVIRSTFKHLYIKFIKEPLSIYARI